MVCLAHCRVSDGLRCLWCLARLERFDVIHLVRVRADMPIHTLIRGNIELAHHPTIRRSLTPLANAQDAALTWLAWVVVQIVHINCP